MPTQYVKMLIDHPQKPDDDDESDAFYNQLEESARSALIEQKVIPSSGLAFEEDAAVHNHAAEDCFLYIGTHECAAHDSDDEASIRLFCWGPTEDTPDCADDSLTWYFNTVDTPDVTPGTIIEFCPYCGLDLLSLITNDGRVPHD